MSDPFRICALCRHFELVEEGREFPQIADTAYAVFRCAKLDCEVREDYLMDANSGEKYSATGPNECPYWEAHD